MTFDYLKPGHDNPEWQQTYEGIASHNDKIIAGLKPEDQSPLWLGPPDIRVRPGSPEGLADLSPGSAGKEILERELERLGAESTGSAPGGKEGQKFTYYRLSGDNDPQGDIGLELNETEVSEPSGMISATGTLVAFRVASSDLAD